MRFENVAVVMGGTSSEREVSLRSGKAVAQGLAEAGYRVNPVILERDSVDAIPPGVDAVFIALHGGYGENGGIQADLDARGIPYTGSGAAASRLAIDKVATKTVLAAAGMRTATHELLGAADRHTSMVPPFVVKPPCDGSSVGISLVRDIAALPEALALAQGVDPLRRAMVEAYIPGREWTAGVLIDRALPAIEICAPNGWYGFDAKYTAGKTRYVFADNKTDAAIAARCEQLALLAFRASGCRGYARIDFRVTPEGIPFVLEINTVPGFTETSLLPKAAARAGIPFSALCAAIIQAAKHD